MTGKQASSTGPATSLNPLCTQNPASVVVVGTVVLDGIRGGPLHNSGTRVGTAAGTDTETGATVLGGTVAAGGIGSRIGGGGRGARRGNDGGRG